MNKEADEYLIQQLMFKATGANIHKVKSKICAYRQMIEMNMEKEAKELETKFRIFIATGELI